MNANMGMTRNDLTNWMVYWLRCDVAQSMLLHRRLCSLTMDELRDLESRSFRGGDAPAILSELLADMTPASATGALASV
jgi:hypothetical protein